MVRWLALTHAAFGFQIGTVQYYPTWDIVDTDPEIPGSGTRTPTVPSVPSVDGIYDVFNEGSAAKALSRFLHIGCFVGPRITPSFITSNPDPEAEIPIENEGQYGDPNACVNFCTDPVKNEEARAGAVYVAVKRQMCFCFFDNDLSIFTEVQQSYCAYSCGPFANPLCGGQGQIQDDLGIIIDIPYYSIFKEYDFLSMASQGAYDPWRSIFYQVVVVKERSIHSSTSEDSMSDVSPERYYLHAVSTDLGSAMFQYQMELHDGMLYGLQFDLDDSRLAAIAISKVTGRIPGVDEPWTHRLAIIAIDTKIATFPQLTLSFFDLKVEGGFPAVSQRFLSFVGASGIYSKRGQDTLIFTQLATSKSSQDTEAKDMLYAVDLGDPSAGYSTAGKVFYSVETDMKVLQIMVNEAKGTVTAIGPGADNKHIFKKFGSIIYDDQQIKTFLPVTAGEALLMPQSITSLYSDLYLLPAVCTSEHIDNWSIMGARQIHADWDPETDDPIGQTFFKINIDTGVPAKYCRPAEQDPECEKGIIDPEIPYAALYNREPRIPLSLPAAQMLSARFTKDGTHITILFDRITLKGSIPEDTNNDQLPDTINSNCESCLLMAMGEFNCNLVLDGDSVEMVGEYDCGARCLWTQAGQAIVARLCDSATIEVGSSLALKPNVVYTLPPNEKPLRFSMPTSHLIRVTPPEGDLVPNVIISADSTTLRVDQCSNLYIDAESTLGVGGKDRGTFEWSVFDDIKSTIEGSIDIDLQAVETFMAELEKATLANLKVLSVESDIMPISTIFPIQLKVTSRWGPEYFQIKQFRVEKLNYEAPSVSVEKNVTGDFFRYQGLMLAASCSPSLCNVDDVAPTKQFQWDKSDESPPIRKWETMSKTGQSLILEPFSLDKNESYTFDITCTLKGVTSGSTASINVVVSRSPIVLSGYFQRKHQKGVPLIFDGSACYDPDEQFVTGPQLQFQYTYTCLNENREPCYEQDPPSSELINPPACYFRDRGKKLLVAGKAYPSPDFEPGEQYCQISRGIIVMNTEMWPDPDPLIAGGVPYTIGVTVTSVDGRSQQEDITISFTLEYVPDVFLPRESFDFSPRLDGCDRVPRGAFITLAGVVYLNDLIADISFRWEINRKVMRDVRNADGTPTQTHSYEPTDIDTTDTNFFTSSGGTLEIAPGVFEEGVEYSIRMYATVEVVDGPRKGESYEGHADLDFAVAFYPASSGTLTIDLVDGEMGAEREISVQDWKAAREPILYDFAAIVCVDPECTEMARLAIGPADKLKKRFKVGTSDADWLPKGDPNNDYSLLIEVTVRAFCSSPITVKTEIFSRPPSDPGLALERMSADISGVTDPNESMATLSSMVNILDDSDESKKYAADILGQALATTSDESIPLTSSTITKGFSMVSSAVKVQGRDITDDAKEDALALMETYSEGVVTDQGAMMAFSAIDALLLAYDRGLVGTQKREVEGIPLAQSISTSTGSSTSAESSSTVTNFLTSGSVSDIRKKRVDSRPDANHSQPSAKQRFIDDCWTDYCDIVGIHCLVETESNTIHLFRCCDAPNIHTICNEPPCWFAGSRCPAVQASESATASSERRRMTSEKEKARGKTPTPQAAWFQEYQKVTGQKDVQYDPLHDTISEHAKLYEELRRIKNDGLWNRTRRLEEGTNTTNVTAAIPLQREILLSSELITMENAEQKLWPSAKAYMAKIQHAKEDDLMEEAKKEVLCHILAVKDPEDCELLRIVENAKRKKELETKMAKDRFNAQLTTRLFAVRDRVCKQVLQKITAPSLDAGDEPKFKTRGFQIWMGRKTSLINLHNRVSFPSTWVATPPESFYYVYIEYIVNPYGWSDDNPPRDKTVIITLQLFNSKDLDDIVVFNEPVPIRVFSDKTLYSTGLCMFWNRFAPDSSGGAWSTQGLINDGNGCLTTHLNDIGIFLDGNLPIILELHEAATYYKPGTVDRMKFNTIAIAGMVVVFHIVLAFWGYKHDDKVRENIRRGKIPFQQYHFDGDGITTPMNVNDPIAYKWSHLRNPLFVQTFWNVIKRDHIFIASYYYHVQFSRPQRLLCALVLETGIMGVNAVIYGNPNKLASAEQYIVSGVFSALLIFPFYCCVLLMFNSRPTVIRKTLIRRAHQSTESDMVKRETKRLEQLSMHMPAGDQYAALPAPPPSSLLALPPVVPTIPAVPNAMQPYPGMLALPPPPGATAGIQPPPPRYPPPPVLSLGGGPGGPYKPPQAALPPIFFSAKTPGPPMPHMLVAGQRNGAMAKPPPPPPIHDMRALPPVPNLEAMSGGQPALPSAGPSTPTLAMARQAPPAPPQQPPSNVGITAGPMSPTAKPPLTPPPQHQHLAPSASTPKASSPAPPSPAHQLFEGEHKTNAPDSARSSRTPPAPRPPLPPAPPAPPGGAAPPSMPGSISSPRTPSLPPPSTRSVTQGMPTPLAGSLGAMSSMMPPTMPPTMPLGAGQEFLVTRGQPPSIIPPPFPPARLPTGMPDLYPGGARGNPPPAPPSFVPPPPPPLREDESQFVRRVRMVYMDRVIREHQKLDLLQQKGLGKEVPNWVYNTATFLPYLCCIVFLTTSVILTMIYAVKFDTYLEERWDYACLVGLGITICLLEMIRMCITTLVELRKFEIRKKAKAGDFSVRRVKKGLDDRDPQTTPALLKPKHNADSVPEKTPMSPSRPPRFDMKRPAFLPPEVGAAVPPPKPPPPPPEGAVPIMRPPGNRVPPSPPRTPSQGSPSRTPLNALRSPKTATPPGKKGTLPRLNINAPLLPSKLDREGSFAHSPTNSQASRLSQQLHDSLRSRVAPPSDRSTRSRQQPPPPPPLPVNSPSRRSNSPSESSSSHPKPPAIPPPSSMSNQRAKMRRAK